MDNLINKLSTFSGGKVLDVATGRGEFIRHLKAYLKDYDEIIGIDHMKRAIEHCEEQFKESDIYFKQMDAESLDYDNDVFDTVCISNSIHHLPNKEAVLMEMKRVLKPGGRFIIVEMFSDNQTPEQMSHVKLHHFSAQIDQALGSYHEETYTRTHILNIGNKIELSNVEVFDYAHSQKDPKEEKLINHLTSLCDQLLARVKKHENYDQYNEKCEMTKNWIRENGFSSATELFILGDK
ncbi:class I SAM-dependent methyltransferase [Haloplasma contractile]|uniref:Ubiquinone-menaquinone biosynthesis methyltransferase protein n=1 Tax=Haloplasma contractile SSD-17B TaxID=1033810 RepID=U2DYA1_9MOLU|nr:methyltransferase domain-containing protein [Haloplasma contractile]ERJ13237.1 ubiquinone-menaquinone biosynthesis methyltransferase protein [Haloplasma contractile SSD-17B]